MRRHSSCSDDYELIPTLLIGFLRLTQPIGGVSASPLLMAATRPAVAMAAARLSDLYGILNSKFKRQNRKRYSASLSRLCPGRDVNSMAARYYTDQSIKKKWHRRSIRPRHRGYRTFVLMRSSLSDLHDARSHCEMRG